MINIIVPGHKPEQFWKSASPTYLTLSILIREPNEKKMKKK